VSQFSDVDAAPDAVALEAYLDLAARRLSAMKRYIVGAHLAAGSAVVLDVGCGTGHDLELLAASGVRSVGVDASVSMLTAARRRGVRRSLRGPLVRARGEVLPFVDEAFDGCRVDRVLQHVQVPELVVREAVRCVRRGGLLTVFEPDWSSLRVASDAFDTDAVWLANVCHPGIGRELRPLLESVGVEIVDEVEERSVWRSFALADRLVNVTAGIKRRIEAGAFTPASAAAWLDEQRSRDRDGAFVATVSKVLVVGQRR
jgi:SAM-dependent methyltransferase